MIEERPLSLALADRTGIRHESPQTLLIKDGRGVWSASHRGVTAAALKAAVTGA